MKIKFILFFTILYLPLLCFSQSKYVVNNEKGVCNINFKLLNNVIIIPINVNGVELSFLLDSGVNKPILFNFLKTSDSIKILNTKKVYLNGLGNNGKVEALKSSGNTFKIGDAVNTNQDFYIVVDSSINFAPKLGVPIHGIIGYDLFKDLVVDINYIKKKIKLTNPEKYKYKKCRKCETFELKFYNNKPYFNVLVTIKDKDIPVKLLIDSGSSDALWLFENDSLGLAAKDNYFVDFLGYGLSGSVHGKCSKIDAFKIKSFNLNKPLVAYPDSSFTSVLREIKGRRGSVGGSILKRFNITMDYGKAIIVLKTNSNFSKHFSYNKSGIEVENKGIRLFTKFTRSKAYTSSYGRKNEATLFNGSYTGEEKFLIKKGYTISSIRTNSPSDIVGLQKGDMIIKINGIDTVRYNLQELSNKFYGKEGDRINMVVERLGKRIKVSFKLKSLIK